MNKNLKRLSRTELLELLLVQTRETERLQELLEKAEAKLSDRYLQIQEAGDLAHAVLSVNKVMEAAQAAAQQYLANIAAMEEETRIKCEQMISDARKEADWIRGLTIEAGQEDGLPDDSYFEKFLNNELTGEYL